MSKSTKIKAIRLGQSRNHAHFQFMMAVVALILETNPNRLGIKALFDVFQMFVNKEDDALKKIVKSEYTEKIKLADKERDRVYQCITTIVKALLKHFNDDAVKAAKRLQMVIEAYGKRLTQLSLNEQTSAIYNILQEFNGKYAPDVELLRMTEMVVELERTNKAVDALITERNNETAARNPETMKEARADSDKSYLDIVNRISALVEVEGDENYAEFITKLNVIIDNYKLLITKSHRHAKPAEPAKAKAAEKAKPEAKAKAKPAAKAGAKAKPKAKAKENKTV